MPEKIQGIPGRLAMRVGVLCLLLFALAVPGTAIENTTAAAGDSPSAVTTTGTLVAIESTTLNPGTFFTGDTGTLTVKVTNRGTSAIRIAAAHVRSSDFDVLNEKTYSTVGPLEAGSSRELTFTLRARAGDGVYYPEVQFDMGDAGSIKYAVPIRVDNSPLQVSLMNTPDTYMKGQKNTVTVAVFNPRQSTVNSVVVRAAGPELTVSDSAGFIGSLGPDQSRNITFSVTPAGSTNLTLDVSYTNGLSDRSAVLTVPITVGDRSTAAEPVVSDVEVTNAGGTYTVTGDVTNAGINDARVVVVTVGSPAEPADPNRVYVVGSLESDDFASFELTFRASGVSTVPLLVQYKDEDGNTFERSVEISISGGSGGNSTGGAVSGNSAAGGPPEGGPGAMGGGMMGGLIGGGRPGSSSGGSSIPVLPIAGVLVVLVVLGVAWKKGWIEKVRGRLRKKE
ncbi:MAG: COG1361 S-layer family protein [Methanoregulaceae archaeon]